MCVLKVHKQNKMLHFKNIALHASVFILELYDARKPPALMLLSVRSLTYSWLLEELMLPGSSVPQSLASSGALLLFPSNT